MANKTPSSPPYKGLYVPVDVHHYKYIVDDAHIGDIYLDMKGPVAFHCFRRDEWTPWHGVWHGVGEIGQVKIEFDPDATDQGFRAYKWTYVFMHYYRLSTGPRYGIDSAGRPIRIERRCEWYRHPDGSYERIEDELDLISYRRWMDVLLNRIRPGTPG